MRKPTLKTLAFRRILREEAGLKPSENEIKIEIRPGIEILYQTSAPYIHLNNFLFQTIGMWLWKWSLSKEFETRIIGEELRENIACSFPPRMINKITIGRVINCMRTKTSKIQFGSFDRPYGYKWNGPEDLTTSMWLLTKTWIYEQDVTLWNNGTPCAPGDGSRSAIEEELNALNYSSVVDAYYSQRRNTWFEWSTLLKYKTHGNPA